MMKKFKFYSLFMLALFVSLVFLVNYATVKAAVITYNEDEEQYPYCLNFYMGETNGFPISSVKINENEWHDDGNDYVFRNNSKNYTVIVKAGMKGTDYPEISLAGGFEDNGGTRSAVPNPEQDDNIEGDEFIFTFNLGEGLYTGVHDGPVEQQHCSGFGFNVQSGPPITAPLEDVSSNISITISGDELEYHYDSEHLDEADVTYFKFNINGGIGSHNLVPFTFRNAEYTYNSNPAPNNVSSVHTKEPINYTYPYDGSGEVEFCINGGGTDEYTHIYINGVDYQNQAPHTQVQHFESMNGWAQMFCISHVPYNASGYNVVVEGERTADENKIPGFGWNYLSADRSDDITSETEGNFAHGRLEFWSASITIDNEYLEFDSADDFNNFRYHGTGQIFQFNDGDKNYPEEERWRSWGSAQLPFGTTITVRIVPDEGYQLTGLTVSPNGFQATNTPGLYTLTLNRSNLSYNEDMNQFDLNPTFTQVGATAVTDSEAVSNVTIQVSGGENAFATGTPKLEVNDVASMSPERLESFEEAAESEGYTINNYLEISLYNALYKGGKVDDQNNYLSWDTEVSELENNATISLELNEALDGSEVAVIHEIRDGGDIRGYDVIEGTYNANSKTVTFETDGFSTYAVAYKGDAPVVSTTHTVEFNTTGGSQMDPVYIEDGEVLQRPSDPGNGDKVFGGWYTDEDCKNEYNFNNPVTGDLILYAKWLEQFRVDFDTRSETGMDPVYVTEGEKLQKPNDPVNGDLEFGGWYTDEDFKEAYNFNNPVTENLVLYAKWVVPTAPYEVDNNGITMAFRDEVGHTFDLTIIDYYAFTDEDLETYGIDKNEYNTVFALVTDNIKNKGDLLAFYEIVITDENGVELHEALDGGFDIKIPLTPEMKKYNSFKLIYMNDDMTPGEEVILTVEGDFLVGTLPHLSNYSLVGNVVDNSSNPKTFDDIYTWIGLLMASLLGIIITVKKAKN